MGSDDKKEEEQPPGGWEDAPVPRVDEPGFTIKITIHRATNLPMADYASMSSDPYVLALLQTDLPQRHKDVASILTLRTPTVHRSVTPIWDTEWVVANVPASGFRLKCRVMDEDEAGHDDRLGNAHVNVASLSENFSAIREAKYEVEKRSGSWRAYGVRMVANAVSHEKSITGDLYVSVEVLGRTKTDNGGKMFTVGPGHWSQHFSPLIGRIAGTKADTDEDEMKKDPNGKQVTRYDFEANQLQLSGRVPDDLFHRYVEFKGFVKGMFKKEGIRGHILHKLLSKQHLRIYSFDRDTKYGSVPEPGDELARQFLKMVHHDEGGRLFTYVLMLDGQLRFTETGKSFGIDLLSKHTMHSNVTRYIACSGEFFVRRLRTPEEGERPVADRDTHPPKPLEGGPPKGPPPNDPRLYELVIDNDSGTYRPKKELLPQLRDFLAQNFGSLQVTTMACDDDKLQELKAQQRKVRMAEGDHNVYAQVSDSDSLSSSDEEDLARRGDFDAETDEEREERQGKGKRERSKKKATSAKSAMSDPKAALFGWAAKET